MLTSEFATVKLNVGAAAIEGLFRWLRPQSQAVIKAGFVADA